MECILSSLVVFSIGTVVGTLLAMKWYTSRMKDLETGRRHWWV